MQKGRLQALIAGDFPRAWLTSNCAAFAVANDYCAENACCSQHNLKSRVGTLMVVMRVLLG